MATEASVQALVAARRRHRRLTTVLSYAVLTAGALIVLFPIYMAVVESLLTPVQIGSNPPYFVPTTPQFHAYKDAFTTGHLGHYIWNSVIQTLEIVIGSVLTSVLAAYAFAAFSFPFKRVLWAVMLSTLLIPFEVTIVTNYHTIQSLHLLGTMWALTVPFMMSAIGVFLLRQAFMAIAVEMREAAVLDGCGPIRYLVRIAIPLVRPQIAAFVVIATLGAWNQYLWPLLLTSNDESHRTLQIGLKALNAGTFQSLGTVLAGAVIAAVPMLLLMVVFNKQLVRSLTAGAVK